MDCRKRDEAVLPREAEDELWELFHENSKLTRYQRHLTDAEVLARMASLWESLPFDDCESFDLPARLGPLSVPLGTAISERVSARALTPGSLTLETVASVLHHAYGVTRTNVDGSYPRPFRAAPSAGALYPLELFIHSAHIEGIPTGVFHYNPSRHQLRLVKASNETAAIAGSLVQGELATNSSMIVFISCFFNRLTFKYGNRGYRFALMEAGHVAQNLNLVAQGVGLGCVNIGGFYDHKVDDLLGLNGITQSIVYMVCFGNPCDATRP